MMKCECGNEAKYECHCGEPICQACVDDPTNPASHDWHATGWAVCSYKCEDKAIDDLKDECDTQGRTIQQSKIDITDIIRYAEAARDSLYSCKPATALLHIGRILAYEYLIERKAAG